jgi:hypothetical protein
MPHRLLTGAGGKYTKLKPIDLAVASESVT